MKFLLLIVSFLPWVLKRWSYAILLNARIAPSARVGFGSWIIAKNLVLAERASIGVLVYANCETIALGEDAVISRQCHLSLSRIVMGRKAILGKRVEINGGQSSGECRVEIGDQSWIFQDSFLNASAPIVIGKNVGIGGRSLLFTHGYWLSRFKGFPYAKGGITIKDNVWLPWECFVMPGVTIGQNAVIGARSVINKDVAPGNLVAGVPAKVLKEQSWLNVDSNDIMAMFKEWLDEFSAVHMKEQRVIEHGPGKLVIKLGGLRITAASVPNDLDITLEAPKQPAFRFLLASARQLEGEDVVRKGDIKDFIDFGRRYGFRILD